MLSHWSISPNLNTEGIFQPVKHPNMFGPFALFKHNKLAMFKLMYEGRTERTEEKLPSFREDSFEFHFQIAETDFIEVSQYSIQVR